MAQQRMTGTEWGQGATIIIKRPFYPRFQRGKFQLYPIKQTGPRLRSATHRLAQRHGGAIMQPIKQRRDCALFRSAKFQR